MLYIHIHAVYISSTRKPDFDDALIFKVKSNLMGPGRVGLLFYFLHIQHLEEN